MSKVHDFENKQDYEKTVKLVKKLKPVKSRGKTKDLKVTGRITQVISPNEFILKTKLGKHIPIVTDKDINVIFDYYDTALVIVNDPKGNGEYSLDIKYDVTVILGDVCDFQLGDETFEKVAYKLDSFWGIER